MLHVLQASADMSTWIDVPVDDTSVTETVIDSDPDAQMFDSIRKGLEAARRLKPDFVLLHPADVPFVPGSATRRLVSEPSGLARMAFNPVTGRGGHPVLIPVAILAA